MIRSSSDTRETGSLNITVENFRPNLVVSGGDGVPHQEDQWKTVQLQALRRRKDGTEAAHTVTLQVTGPCSRCSMVNVDGTSGSMDCRAFQALSTYRKDGPAVYFGQFCAFAAPFDGEDEVLWLQAGESAECSVTADM